MDKAAKPAAVIAIGMKKPASSPKDTGTEEGSESGIDFDVPQGFEPPEGIKPGDEFEAVASFKIEDDGKTMCITKLEGIPVGDAAEESDEANPQAKTKGKNPDFLSSVESGLQGSSSPPEAASSGQTY